MHGTDMQAARERATQTENEQSPDLPFELLSQQCLLQTRASAVQVLLTGSRRTEGGKAGEKQNKQKPKQTNHQKPQGSHGSYPLNQPFNSCSSRNPSSRHSKEMVPLIGLILQVYLCLVALAISRQ